MLFARKLGPRIKGIADCAPSCIPKPRRKLAWVRYQILRETYLPKKLRTKARWQSSLESKSRSMNVSKSDPILLQAPSIKRCSCARFKVDKRPQKHLCQRYVSHRPARDDFLLLIAVYPNIAHTVCRSTDLNSLASSCFNQLPYLPLNLANSGANFSAPPSASIAGCSASNINFTGVHLKNRASCDGLRPLANMAILSHVPIKSRTAA